MVGSYVRKSWTTAAPNAARITVVSKGWAGQILAARPSCHSMTEATVEAVRVIRKSARSVLLQQGTDEVGKEFPFVSVTCAQSSW